MNNHPFSKLKKEAVISTFIESQGKCVVIHGLTGFTNEQLTPAT